MIFVTYAVDCDGPHPDLPDDMCEAEFSVGPQKGTSDIAALRRQLDGRGWRTKKQNGQLKFFCPLHKEPTQ